MLAYNRDQWQAVRNTQWNFVFIDVLGFGFLDLLTPGYLLSPIIVPVSVNNIFGTFSHVSELDVIVTVSFTLPVSPFPLPQMSNQFRDGLCPCMKAYAYETCRRPTTASLCISSCCTHMVSG